MQEALKWFRFDRMDCSAIQERLFDLGYSWSTGGRVQQKPITLSTYDAIVLYPNKNLGVYSQEYCQEWFKEIPLREALNLTHTDSSHFNFETADGKMTSVKNPNYIRGHEFTVVWVDERADDGEILEYSPVKLKPTWHGVSVAEELSKLQRQINENIKAHKPLNTQSLPREYSVPYSVPGVQVGETIICGDSNIPEGTLVYFGAGMDCCFPYDVQPEEMSDSTWKAPCRCESLLKGHEMTCHHHPAFGKVPTPEEKERQRLENVWAIPKPREPLSYKTAMDQVGGNAPHHHQKIAHLVGAYGCAQKKMEEFLPRWFREALT